MLLILFLLKRQKIIILITSVMLPNINEQGCIDKITQVQHIILPFELTEMKTIIEMYVIRFSLRVSVCKEIQVSKQVLHIHFVDPSSQDNIDYYQSMHDHILEYCPKHCLTIAMGR